MTRVTRDHMRQIRQKQELFPCEGEQAKAKHLSAYEVNTIWQFRMEDGTETHSSCRWVSCPAYRMCDLSFWGGDSPRERDKVESMLVEMATDITTEQGPFCTKERMFLQEMLDRMEASPQFIPSKRQEGWVESLHERWVGQ